MGYSSSFGIASLGIRLNYIQYRAEGFETQDYLTFDFGGVTRLTDQLTIGAFIKNINQPLLSDFGNERIPAQMVFGVKFSPTEFISIIGEVDKTLNEVTTWKGALEYIIYKKIFFRTGFNIDPNAGFFGIGYNHNKFNVDYAIQFLEQLQAGHQVSVSYRIKNKTETGK
ncbi:MAG: hypothetical protein HC811_03260 [Flammeovirgaceae bacterium]|nr:hypothetical protein [Flammeovirgaceae bacterium]